MTQERMIDADTAKFDAKKNAKADAPDTSGASKIDTPKIYVKRGIGKACAVAIALSRRMYLIQQALCDGQLDGEGADTWNFNAKKEAKKSDAEKKPDVILTSRLLSLR